MSALRFEGRLELHTEDGGRALIGEVEGADDDRTFVRLQSWSDDKQHPELAALDGKRIRVTIEVLDG